MPFPSCRSLWHHLLLSPSFTTNPIIVSSDSRLGLWSLHLYEANTRWHGTLTLAPINYVIKSMGRARYISVCCYGLKIWIFSTCFIRKDLIDLNYYVGMDIWKCGCCNMPSLMFIISFYLVVTSLIWFFFSIPIQGWPLSLQRRRYYGRMDDTSCRPRINLAIGGD